MLVVSEMKGATEKDWAGIYQSVEASAYDGEGDPLFVRAAARTMRVLSAFHSTVKPLSLTEIAQASNLDRSTTQRLVHTLRKTGYIERDEFNRGYVPGIRLYDHVFDAMRLNGLIQRAVPHLIALRDRLGERVDLSLIDDVRLVYATRFQPKRNTLYAMMLGHSVPIYCTSAGWSVLSKYDEDTARDVIKRSALNSYTAQTVVDEDAIMANVEQARGQGYAIAREQLMPGEIAIGAAITDSNDKPVGAITISAMTADWSVDGLMRDVAPPLLQTINALKRG